MGRESIGKPLSRLGREFFERYTPVVAKDLLGCRLVRVWRGKRFSGIIVETEAYRGKGDPASHAYPGRTPRSAVMFGEAGHAYVYFSYGFHNCMNVTTERPGVPGAVLLRALQPSEGASEMSRRIRAKDERRIANGPGKLTYALRIDRGFNGEDLVHSPRLFVESGASPGRIVRSERVGISRGTERKWRYYVAGSAFVSPGRPSQGDLQNP